MDQVQGILVKCMHSLHVGKTFKNAKNLQFCVAKV